MVALRIKVLTCPLTVSFFNFLCLWQTNFLKKKSKSLFGLHIWTPQFYFILKRLASNRLSSYFFHLFHFCAQRSQLLWVKGTDEELTVQPPTHPSKRTPGQTDGASLSSQARYGPTVLPLMESCTEPHIISNHSKSVICKEIKYMIVKSAVLCFVSKQQQKKNSQKMQPCLILFFIFMMVLSVLVNELMSCCR